MLGPPRFPSGHWRRYAEALAEPFAQHTKGLATFVGMNMAEMETWFLDDYANAFSQITCQRAIHYLPRDVALGVLRQLRLLLRTDGALFISCSGLGSELGTGYPGEHVPVSERFDCLASEMADKHSIKHPVCLYTEDEFQTLLEEAGFRISKIYASAFGNLKVIATIA